MTFLSDFKADFVVLTDKIVLEEPLVFYDEKLDRKFTVPKGFSCDGASIPRLFWTLVGHPLQHGVRRAAVCHDYLYRFGKCSRANADRIFREAMKERKVNWLRRSTYWLAVRCFGWITHNPKKEVIK